MSGSHEREVSGVALVTGGDRGIGFEVARQLARRGMTVIIGARDPEKAGTAVGELADSDLDVRAGALDVTDDGSVGELADRGGTAASYGISKAAVNALTSKPAAELDGTGILINSAAPGLAATPAGCAKPS